MVRAVQTDCANAGRDCARKGGCIQSCKSKRGRQSESFVEVQHSRDSGAAFFQERPTARSGDRRHEQKGSAQPAGSAGVEKVSLREIDRVDALRRPEAANAASVPRGTAPGGSNPQPLAPE